MFRFAGSRFAGFAAALALTTTLTTPAMAQATAEAGVEAPAETLLLRSPDLSAQHLTFTYAGDVWIADRDGSNPQRLTSHPADARAPLFSADGSMIAYTVNYDGNYDVFIIPASGGQPKRLTWHPGTETLVGFSPDGSHVYFTSARERRAGRAGQLYRVSIDGGLPEKISEARTFAGALSEDGETYANVPIRPGYNGLAGGTAGWRGYRGGAAPSVQLINFDERTFSEIPGDRTTEWDPHFIGDTLYLISDRDDARLNVFRHNPADNSLTRITNETEFDVRSIGGHGGTLVYESGGRIHSLDLVSGTVTPLSISLNADLPAKMPGWRSVAGQIEDLDISPTGQRVAVTARGEVFTVPIENGSTRNITASAGERDYSGIWSPDGTQLAFVEDNGSSQTLVIKDQSGIGSEQRFDLGGEFNFLQAWSGDHIVFEDNKLRLRALAVETGEIWTIVTSVRRGIGGVSMAPEGRYVAFTATQVNNNSALYLYDLETRQTAEVTGDFADIGSPTFSNDGSLLFFTASTNAGPTQVGLDMSTQQQPYRAGIYAAILAADGENPLAPQLGDEEPADSGGEGDEAESPDSESSSIDLAGVAGRIIALPVNEEFYTSLAAGADGALYFVSRVQPGVANTAPGNSSQAGATLGRFDFEKREASTVAGGIVGMQIDRSGTTLLLARANGSFVTAKAGADIKPEPLDLSGLRMMIDPAVEWGQIFNDVARFEAAYFYDPNMHGLDWAAVQEKYSAFLPHVGRREDLNEVMVEMIAEMFAGHNRVGGGETYDNSAARPGLLGADLEIDQDRYRIAKIFDGVRWNPFLDAPLAKPGVNVGEGDYILAVNGQSLTGDDNIFRHLSGTRGSQVTLTIASDAAGTDRRDVVIEPTGSEGALRLWDWVETRRQRVEEATNGRVAYVYMPDTFAAGFTIFNRMFFAQADKEALILDDRSNGGGQAANYVIELLNRPVLGGWRDREGLPFTTPGAFISGPKTMLIDQDAGSGGDFMPYAFRYTGLGPLIGTRTWGGLIGIAANPGLVDGGFVTVPFFRFYTPEGEYTIENEGVAPDYRVELDQLALDEGRDTQLEAAIGYILGELEDAEPVGVRTAPPPPTELGQ
ncbi:MAG: PDZ domain-containing protein [Pseudomonadota bacterium]